MLSYYFQNKNKYKNIKIILIIDETYKKSEFRRYDNKIIVNILKIIDPKLMQYESIKISNGSNFKLKNALYFIKNFNPKSQEAFVNTSPNRYKPNKAKVISAAGFLFIFLKEEI